LFAEGVAAADIDADFKVDLRYQGQTATLTLPWRDVGRTREAFHEEHERRYGHRLGTPVELVNIRASLHGRPPDITLPKLAERTGGAVGPQYARLAGYADDVPVWRREHLQSAQLVTGPALITETVATTYLPAGWRCRVDETGNLQLEVER
jgi:N-methylhydantoinase A